MQNVSFIAACNFSLKFYEKCVTMNLSENERFQGRSEKLHEFCVATNRFRLDSFNLESIQNQCWMFFTAIPLERRENILSSKNDWLFHKYLNEFTPKKKKKDQNINEGIYVWKKKHLKKKKREKRLITRYTHERKTSHTPAVVPACLPSRGGDAAVCFWHKPTELACSSSVLFLCLFMSFMRPRSTVFHSINSPHNSPLSHSVLPLLFLPYSSFQLYLSFWKSPSAPI